MNSIFEMMFAVVVSLFILLDYPVNAHVIKTRLGKLEGVSREARNRKIFHAYYGIPFAKPPVQKLRFEPPVQSEPWSGILDATKPPPPCPQIHTNGTYEGQEDCLFLYVYTPQDAEPGKNLPVLFYIFGGGFNKGVPSNYGPEYIMSRDVILVVVNYRLGALGFLSTADTVIAGNMALKDQTMAMKWTKENIYDFGGDPNRITIHGHSAGSACVHLHTMSPLSEDHFNQAIMQSGFGVNPQHIWDRDFARDISRRFGLLLKCPITSSEALRNCLLKKSAQQLAYASEKLYVWLSDPIAFTPVIEDENVKNPFLTQLPRLATYPSSDKRWLLGIASNEGALFVGRIYFHPDSSVINMDPKLSFPLMGFLKWNSKPNHLQFIVKLLKSRFFGDEEVKNTTDVADMAIAKMLSGILYGDGLINTVQRYSGPKYVYLFDYRYSGGYTDNDGGRDGRYLGVGHADEIPIIFKRPNATKITDEDFAFGDEMIARWVNFVYSGDPNVPFPINTSVFGAWEAVSSSSIEFLRIRRNGGMEKDYLLEEYGFWRKIPVFSKYFEN